MTSNSQVGASVVQNAPLWLETFLEPSNQDDALRFSYIVHCALDAVDEKRKIRG